MKKSFIIGGLALTVVSFLFSFSLKNKEEAPAWNLDNAHSSVRFTASHFFIPVDGTFDKFTGTLKFDPANLEGSSASFTIDVNSVSTKDAKRDGHLKSKDFFDAGKYPSIIFKSDKFEKKSEKEYVIKGKLTINDKTLDVDLPFTLLAVQDHPMMKGSLLAGIKSETTIDRTKFGVGTGDWASNSVVGDDVGVKIVLELNRKK